MNGDLSVAIMVGVLTILTSTEMILCAIIGLKYNAKCIELMEYKLSHPDDKDSCEKDIIEGPHDETEREDEEHVED